MSSDVTITASVVGGSGLCVTKEGSTVFIRVSFNGNSFDSPKIDATTSPSDIEIAVEGRFESAPSSGRLFVDQMVRYPMVITIIENLAKEKKQKEEKYINLGSTTLDLLPFLTGLETITRDVKVDLTEIPAPNSTATLRLNLSIDQVFEKSFLEKENRIVTIRLLAAGQVPDSWCGSTFNASLPIPKPNGEVTPIMFSGKAEPTGGKEGEETNTENLYWIGQNGEYLTRDDPEAFEMCPIEEQNGEECDLSEDGAKIQWNLERRLLLSQQSAAEFELRIARLSPMFPLEVVKAKEVQSDKKGKAKGEDDTLQCHGIALLNFSPLLYPGVKSVKGVFPLRAFTESILAQTGYSQSIAAETYRSGSAVSRIEERKNVPRRRQSQQSQIEDKSNTVLPDAIPYNELNTTLYAEICLSRPLIGRVKLTELKGRISDLIPARPRIPRKRYGAAAAINEYHDSIAIIGRQVLDDIRQFGDFDSGNAENYTNSIMYKMNKSGKYNDYHEQLKYSVIRIVREKYLKTTQFDDPDDLKTFLEVLYVYLIEEMHIALNKTIIPDAPQKPEPIATIEELQSAALFAEKMGNLDIANELWSELLARDEINTIHWEGLARTALLRGEPERAHEALQQAISLDHDNPWVMVLAGTVAKDRGEVEMAKALLERAAANPNCDDQTKKEEEPVSSPIERAIAWNILSHIHDEQLEEQLAKFSRLEAEKLSKLFEMSESDVDLDGNLLYLYGAERFAAAACRGISQKMLAQYISTLDVDQMVPGRALLLKAKCEMWSGELSSALETIVSATKADHANPSIWAELGGIHLAMGNNDLAKVALARTCAFETPPDDPVVVYVRLADILLDEGDWAAARQYYLMACRECGCSVAWLGVGICSLRLGELSEAEDALAEANLLDAKNGKVWAYLSLLCLMTNHALEAEQAFKFTQKLNFNEPKLLNEIKQLQRERGFGDPSY